MSLFNNLLEKFIFVLIVVLLTLFTEFTFLKDIRLSLDCIFSGLLALTGFVFTARTFITFKLNEVVYGNIAYRKHVETLQQEGAYKKKLYDPLKKMDTNLGNSTYRCLVTIFLFGVLSFLPEFTEIKVAENIIIDKFYLLFNVEVLKEVVKNKKALAPIPIKIMSDVCLVYFFFCLYHIYNSAKIMNENIQSIIEHWEEDYNNGYGDTVGIQKKDAKTNLNT